MKKIFLLSTFILFALLSNAQSELKIKSASLNFAIKNAGINVDGKFTGFEMSVNFNPNELSLAKIEAKIDVNTINTGINARDKHLKKEEYFDVEKYPKISLTLVEPIILKNNLYYANYELVIKNKKQKINIPFGYVNKKIIGNFTLNRRDFGVGGKSWIMSDKVLVSFEILTE